MDLDSYSEVGVCLVATVNTLANNTALISKCDFGDCFAYALAKATGEPLLFKGDDLATTDVRRVL